MKRSNCIIIEDEPLALEHISDFIEKVPSLYLAASFDNAMSGLEYLKTQEPDILFLDINMDELSGIELLESIKIESEIIITTAYQEYALKGYDLAVTDYLLKPFAFQRFLQAVNRAQENLKKPHQASDFIYIRSEGKLIKVNYHDILYIVGMRDYRRIFTTDRSIMTLQTFRELEQLIPSSIVCRVHKSYMVSLSKIDVIAPKSVHIGDKVIPISKTYKKDFLNRMH